MTSNALAVKEFTEVTTPCPDTPRLMEKHEVEFLIKMCISELVELAQTTHTTEEAVELVKSAATIDLNENYEPSNDLISEQADAMVDCWYYGLNAFAKTGVNLSLVFDEVHRANMNKKFPDGTFHVREDGKILKPPGWQEPGGAIDRQKKNGSWNNGNCVYH